MDGVWQCDELLVRFLLKFQLSRTDTTPPGEEEIEMEEVVEVQSGSDQEIAVKCLPPMVSCRKVTVEITVNGFDYSKWVAVHVLQYSRNC